jgi:chemotaxis protein methyltransferase CheR
MSELFTDIEDIEIDLFIQGMYLQYGYDFRNYSKAHLKRRLISRLKNTGLDSISKMQHEMLRNKDFFYEILPDFSINVTEMFRDPEFFKLLRTEVIPILKTYPQIKIWHAGCSSGEEVYSTAILLKEEGIYDRCQIYATDFNDQILQVAKDGIYPIDIIKDYTTNYVQSGGREDFSDYYIAKYNSIMIDSSLKENITFANHNLVTDDVFGEMHLVICRNVVIYFDRDLQDKVYHLFDRSTIRKGILCLGTKESLKHSSTMDSFDVISDEYRIYQKKLKQ